MVRNWLTTRGERVEYISPDGIHYNFHDPATKALIEMRGWGMPSAQIADVRSPFQHGVTPLSVRIPQRKILMTVRNNALSRNEYWDKRAGLLDVLRLNRTNLNNPSPGHLRWYRSDGTVRQVDVLSTDGPMFDPRPNPNEWDEFAYQDRIEFTAYNPIIYDPDQKSESVSDVSCDTEEMLLFPFSFGIEDTMSFALDVCASLASFSFTYTGNWESFPLITMYGPFTEMSVTHDQTGLILGIENFPILAGESVIWDLSYNRKTVVYSTTEESLLGYVTDASSLGRFAIHPDPTVANGLNSFSIEATEGDVNTSLGFLYYNRYIGI